jgi:hypothetical protein
VFNPDQHKHNGIFCHQQIRSDIILSNTCSPDKSTSKKQSESAQNHTLKQNNAESEPDKPLIGHTVTTKATEEIRLTNTGMLGDKVSYSKSVGKVTGAEGAITLDASNNNGRFDGGSISLGVVTLGFGTDFSLSAGVGAFGYEVRSSIGIGVGLGQYSLGGSHTSEDKTVKGVEATVRPGAGSVIVAAIAAGIIVAPEFTIPILSGLR